MFDSPKFENMLELQPSIDVAAFFRESEDGLVLHDHCMVGTIKGHDMWRLRDRLRTTHVRTATGMVTGSTRSYQPDQRVGHLYSMSMEGQYSLGEVDMIELDPPLLNTRDFIIIGNQLYVTSHESIRVYEFAWSAAGIRDLKQIAEYKDSTLLSLCHALACDPNSGEIFVASSGIDRVLRLDEETGTFVTHWSALQNGYNLRAGTTDNVLVRYDNVTEDTSVPEGFTIETISYANPPTLKTNQRTASINSLSVHPTHPGHLLATLFAVRTVSDDAVDVSGRVVAIKPDGTSVELATGLLNPHGVQHYKDNLFMVANTGAGTVDIFREISPYEWEKTNSLDFNSLPGQKTERAWLQNLSMSRTNQGDILVVVDQQRDGIWLLNLKTYTRRFVSNSNNWVNHKAVLFKV